MNVRCKFRCKAIEPQEGMDPPQSKVTFTAEYDQNLPEDQSFSKWTPAGEFWAIISNPRALAALEVGKRYYIDLSPAD